MSAKAAPTPTGPRRALGIAAAATAALGLAALVLPRQEAAQGPDRDAAGPAPTAEGGLTRVVPDDQLFGADRSDLPAEWRERLLDTDLVRREESFGRLLQAVRRNPSLGAVLRDWAADRRRPELAWTARLALRELARPPVFGFHGHLVLPSGPSEGGPGTAPERSAPEPAGPPLAGGEAQLADSVGWRRGPGGGVTLRVDAVVGGEHRRETYTGGTLSEILAEHPELAELLPPGGVPGLPLGAASGSPGSAVPFGDRRQPWTFGAPVETGVLGVVVRAATPDERRRLGLSAGGLSVQRVVEDSIGAILDIRPGAVLLEINGLELDREDAISAALAARPEGGALRIVLIDGYGRRSARTWRPAPE